MQITQESAKRILSSRLHITGQGLFEGTVASVSNSVFTQSYEDGGSRDYRIVNLKAQTSYGLQQAKETFMELVKGKVTDFSPALNHGISYRDYSMAITKGEDVKFKMENVTLKSGETALLCQSVTPMAAKVATKTSFDDFLNGVTAKAEEVSATPVATVPTKKPVTAKVTK